MEEILVFAGDLVPGDTIEISAATEHEGQPFLAEVVQVYDIDWESPAADIEVRLEVKGDDGKYYTVGVAGKNPSVKAFYD